MKKKSKVVRQATRVPPKTPPRGVIAPNLPEREKVQISTDRPKPPPVFEAEYKIDIQNMISQYGRFTKTYVDLLVSTCLSQLAMEAASHIVVEKMNESISHGIAESDALLTTIENVHDTATSVILMEHALLAAGYNNADARSLARDLLLKEHATPLRHTPDRSSSGPVDLSSLKSDLKEMVEGVGFRLAQKAKEAEMPTRSRSPRKQG